MSEADLQAAIYTALTSDADIMALAAGVYSDTPQADDSADPASFPIVAIGDDVLTAWDTKTGLGQNALCTVNMWARGNSRLEIKRLGALVRNALHYGTLSIVGATHVMTVCQDVTYRKEPDGVTQRGVLLVRVYYEEDS